MELLLWANTCKGDRISILEQLTVSWWEHCRRKQAQYVRVKITTDFGIVIFESKVEEVVNFELRNLAQLTGRIAKGRQNLRSLRWGNFELKKLAHVVEAVDPCSRSSQCTSELLAAVDSFWPCAQLPTIVFHLRAFSVAKRVYLLSLLTEQLGSAEDFTSAPILVLSHWGVAFRD